MSNMYKDSVQGFVSAIRAYHVEIRLLHARYHSLCLRGKKKVFACNQVCRAKHH